jgi:hypothetical protein
LIAALVHPRQSPLFNLNITTGMIEHIILLGFKHQFIFVLRENMYYAFCLTASDLIMQIFSVKISKNQPPTQWLKIRGGVVLNNS